MLTIFNQYENPVTVTIQLLKQLKVKVTDYTVNETILNHPDYASILSISDALNSFHVGNRVIKIEADKLTELPSPFIAFTKKDGGSFVVIAEIKGENVYYINESNKIKPKPLKDLLKEFNGIVLHAHTNEHSGETNFIQAKKKQRLLQLKIPAFIIAWFLLIAIAILRLTTLQKKETLPFNIYFSYIFFLLTKSSGFLVTSLLLWYEADKVNPILQKICSGGKTNCNAVLNSKAAKIFGVSWSEIGFFYFSGSFLFLITSAMKQSVAATTFAFQFIQLLNLIAFLYIFFSFYYQWRVAKQWCPLCLTVQAILLLELITALCFSPSAFRFPSLSSLNSELSTLLFSFSLPIIFWFIIKPLLYKQQKAKQDFRALQRIKFNTEIFNTLLEKQKHITEPTEELGIVLGNKNATNILIKVCNPYCEPCAKAHPEIEKLLEESKDLKVQIIFTATNDEKDFRATPVKHLLAIAEKENEKIIKQALDDWYLTDVKDYKVFAEKYKMNGELKTQNEKIDKMKQWCDKVGIAFTPTIFFNGCQLPDAYGIGDLKYFLAE
jgi:uncharacterized membrane protein